jgi:cytochrome d ubiquinol oxidase subunit I
LIAFIVVYFIVYAAGFIYLFRLMAAPPHHGEQGPGSDSPTRAAGITPAAGAAARGHA